MQPHSTEHERQRERENEGAGERGRERRHWAGTGGKVIGCIWEKVNERILRISPWNT